MYKEKFETDTLENTMEEVVFKEFHTLIKSGELKFCQCKVCIQDIAAIVLNTVPSMYENSEKYLPNNAEKIDMGRSPEIIQQLLRVAIEKVSSAPHH